MLATITGACIIYFSKFSANVDMYVQIFEKLKESVLCKLCAPRRTLPSRFSGEAICCIRFPIISVRVVDTSNAPRRIRV